MTSAVDPSVLVGVDWASRAHEVCALDGPGRDPGPPRIPQPTPGPRGHGRLDGRPRRWRPHRPGRRHRATRRTGRRSPARSPDRRVYHQPQATRPLPRPLQRRRPKDDRRDAWVLADALRTDRHAFREVLAAPPEIVALRGLVREDDALRIEETALSNRLKDLLGRYHPRLLALAADRIDPLLWDLWELAPTPGGAATVSPQAVAAAAAPAPHPPARYRRGDPRLDRPGAAGGRRDGRGGPKCAIRRLLPRLRLAHAQRQECGHRIEARCSRAWKPRSQVGGRTALGRRGPQILARGREGRARPSADRRGGGDPPPRSYPTAGIGGKRPGDQAERPVLAGGDAAGVQRAAAVCLLPLGAAPRCRTTSGAGSAIAALRGRGRSHGRAMRGVVDRLLAVAMAMLRAGTLYDPDLRSSPGGRAQVGGVDRRARRGEPADLGSRGMEGNQLMV